MTLVQLVLLISANIRTWRKPASKPGSYRKPSKQEAAEWLAAHSHLHPIAPADLSNYVGMLAAVGIVSCQEACA